MKALKVLLEILLGVIIIGMTIVDGCAETRTLTTMVVITVRALETQSAAAPNGLEELYKVALSQNLDQRLIKLEEPLNTPSGLARYTMTEKL